MVPNRKVRRMGRVFTPPPPIRLEIERNGHTAEVRVPRGEDITLEFGGTEVTVRAPDEGHGVAMVDTSSLEGPIVRGVDTDESERRIPLPSELVTRALDTILGRGR